MESPTTRREVTPISTLSHLESTLSPLPLNSSTLIQKLEGSTQTERAGDPVASRATSTQQTSMMVDINSLLSSIDQAYGFSSLMEKSKFLSSLVGSRGGGSTFSALDDGSCKDGVGLAPIRATEEYKKAVCIQAWIRGSISRKKFRNLLQQTRAATRIQALW